MDKIADLITADQVLQWIIIAALIAYFIYKEYPEFKRRVSSGVTKEQTEEAHDADTDKRLAAIEKRLDRIDEKLQADYISLGTLQREENRDKLLFKESLEEREIIMRALLGVIGGLQELGANGPTKDAQSEIMDYLAKRAHAPSED
ncbi:MAG: hypothetical protein LUD16_12895 [Lachnospiraceae bacterium]|nr:hypothetical protein [Lachnospiraceae bacterium]